MSKRPPELTWQDKAILITIPLVVFVIFIVTNYVSRDLTVSDAFLQQLPEGDVRDGGNIVKIIQLPAEEIASITQQCRVRSRDGQTEFTFVYRPVATETLDLKVGRVMQFYGHYTYDRTGGTVTVPFKGKSGREVGWVVYESKRYSAKEENNNL